MSEGGGIWCGAPPRGFQKWKQGVMLMHLTVGEGYVPAVSLRWHGLPPPAGRSLPSVSSDSAPDKKHTNKNATFEPYTSKEQETSISYTSDFLTFALSGPGNHTHLQAPTQACEYLCAGKNTHLQAPTQACVYLCAGKNTHLQAPTQACEYLCAGEHTHLQAPTQACVYLCAGKHTHLHAPTQACVYFSAGKHTHVQAPTQASVYLGADKHTHLQDPIQACMYLCAGKHTYVQAPTQARVYLCADKHNHLQDPTQACMYLCADKHNHLQDPTQACMYLCAEGLLPTHNIGGRAFESERCQRRWEDKYPDWVASWEAERKHGDQPEVREVEAAQRHQGSKSPTHFQITTPFPAPLPPAPRPLLGPHPLLSPTYLQDPCCLLLHRSGFLQVVQPGFFFYLHAPRLPRHLLDGVDDPPPPGGPQRMSSDVREDLGGSLFGETEDTTRPRTRLAVERSVGLWVSAWKVSLVVRSTPFTPHCLPSNWGRRSLKSVHLVLVHEALLFPASPCVSQDWGLGSFWIT
ncbi:hypothetical protein JZ751_013646, partial [Albula glossodonta]